MPPTFSASFDDSGDVAPLDAGPTGRNIVVCTSLASPLHLADPIRRENPSDAPRPDDSSIVSASSHPPSAIRIRRGQSTIYKRTYGGDDKFYKNFGPER